MDNAPIIQWLDAEIERLTRARQLLSGTESVVSNGRRRRRRMSADARARIAAAQKARWAKLKARLKKK